MNENENLNPQTGETPVTPPAPANHTVLLDGSGLPVEPTFETPQAPPAYTPPDFTASVQQDAAAPQYQQPNPPGYEPPQYVQNQYNQQYNNQYPQQNQAAPQNYGGYTQPQQPAAYKPHYDTPPVGYQQKSRLAAGLLAILLGTLGIHNFYLGNNTRAVIQLVVSLAGGLITCGAATVAMEVWAFIEGIQLLSGHPSRLYDGNGVITRE